MRAALKGARTEWHCRLGREDLRRWPTRWRQRGDWLPTNQGSIWLISRVESHAIQSHRTSPIRCRQPTPQPTRDANSRAVLGPPGCLRSVGIPRRQRRCQRWPPSSFGIARLRPASAGPPASARDHTHGRHAQQDRRAGFRNGGDLNLEFVVHVLVEIGGVEIPFLEPE